MRELAAIVIATVACEHRVDFESPSALSFYQPSDRDGLGTLYGAACHRLRTLGCPEGFRTRAGLTCFERMTELSTRFDVQAECIKSSPSVYEARGCGWKETLRIACVMPAVDEPGSALP